MGLNRETRQLRIHIIDRNLFFGLGMVVVYQEFQR